MLSTFSSFVKVVNGKKIGNTTYQYPPRRYEIPADLLEEGKNTFVIRVMNSSGKGGFVPDKPYFITANDVKLIYIDCYGINGETGEQLIELVKQAQASGKLLVFLFHGVGGEHSLNRLVVL